MMVIKVGIIGVVGDIGMMLCEGFFEWYCLVLYDFREIEMDLNCFLFWIVDLFDLNVVEGEFVGLDVFIYLVVDCELDVFWECVFRNNIEVIYNVFS